VSREIELPTINPRKSIALIALGMGIYIIYLYQVGFQEVMQTLKSVDIAFFILGVALALFGVFSDSLAWKEIARKFDYKVKIIDFFMIYLSSIFMNNLLPSGSFSGETARIYFLEKLEGGSRIDMPSATVAASRIVTAIPFILGSAVGLSYLALATNAPAWALATCSGITIFLVFLNVIFFGVCFADGWLERIIFALINHLERIFDVHINRDECSGIMSRFHQSMKMLIEHKRTLFISIFWALAGWFSMTLVAVVIFRSMGVSVPIGAVFAVYAVIIFLQMLPLFLPGGVGLVDIVMATLFGAIGVPTSAAVAATILTRLIQLWMLTALGGLSTAYLVKKINHISFGAALRSGAAKSF
jgi:uncharacterized protein (TIRG00374 family)